MTRRVLRQLRRDRRTIAMILVQPIIMMAIFGYALGGDVTEAPVAVANLDRGRLGGEVIARVDPEVVEFVTYTSEAEVERAVRAQEVRVGVVFPVNFTRNFDSGATADPRTVFLVYYGDNTNFQITNAVKGEFVDAFGRAVENETDRTSAFEVDERVVFGPKEGTNLQFLLPGMVAFTVFIIGAMLTTVSIVKERSSGTLPRLLSSPIGRGEVVLGLVLAFATLALLQSISVLAIATLVFGIEVSGNVFLALVTTFLVSLVALGLGILFSGLAKNEFQATQSIMLFVFPNMFLAGLLAPVEAMPTVLRPLTRLVPLTYAIEAERAIINHGAGLLAVAPELLILAAFAAVFLGSGAYAFGRRT